MTWHKCKCWSLILLILLWPLLAHGAEVKVTALTEDTSPASTDLLMTVDDPGGAPITKKATIQNVINAGLPAPGAIGGTTPAAGSFTTLTGRFIGVVTKTANATIAVAELGHSIRYHSTSAGTLTLPSGTDGAIVRFIKTNTGRMSIKAHTGQFIMDSAAAGTIYSDSDAASVTLEYVSSITKWIIVSASGTWTTT